MVRAGVPIVYTPTATRKAEAAIRAALIDQGAQLYDRWAPLALEAVFAVAKPKKAAGYLSHSARRPDLTNYLMLLADAGTGVLWRDDAQLAVIRASKLYTKGAPYVRLTVEPVAIVRPFRHRKPEALPVERKKRIKKPYSGKGGSEDVGNERGPLGGDKEASAAS